MKVEVRLSDKDIKSIINSMVILIDTREQNNQHITKVFDKAKIKYKTCKLDYGDYSVMLPKNTELGIPYDIMFNKLFAIERKNSLDEISGNLTNGRTNFDNEFIRSKFDNCKVHLLIEDGSWDKIQSHDYNTKFNEKSFYNSLISFMVKYDLSVEFVPKTMVAVHMIRVLQIELRKYLKD